MAVKKLSKSKSKPFSKKPSPKAALKTITSAKKVVKKVAAKAAPKVTPKTSKEPVQNADGIKFRSGTVSSVSVPMVLSQKFTDEEIIAEVKNQLAVDITPARCTADRRWWSKKLGITLFRISRDSDGSAVSESPASEKPKEKKKIVLKRVPESLPE